MGAGVFRLIGCTSLSLSLALPTFFNNTNHNNNNNLSGALPLPFVPARVTRGALVADRHSFAPPGCRTSQYRRTFVTFSVSFSNDLSDLVSDGVGLVGFKIRADAVLLA